MTAVDGDASTVLLALLERETCGDLEALNEPLSEAESVPTVRLYMVPLKK